MCERISMKKLIMGLMMSGVIFEVGAAEQASLSDWERAIQTNNTDALERVWRASDKKIPCDQGLAVMAASSLPDVLKTLIRCAGESKCCVRLLREPVMVGTSVWLTAIGVFAMRGRVDECIVIMQRAISPYEFVMGKEDCSREGSEVNLFEFLILNGQYANVQVLLDAASKMGHSYEPARVHVVHCAARRGYDALHYVMRHNLFNAQERVNEYWAGVTPLHTVIKFAMHDDAAVVMAHLLLDTYKADPNVPDQKAGKTPLYKAKRKKMQQLENLLVKYGADPEKCRWHEIFKMDM